MSEYFIEVNDNIFCHGYVKSRYTCFLSKKPLWNFLATAGSLVPLKQITFFKGVIKYIYIYMLFNK